VCAIISLFDGVAITFPLHVPFNPRRPNIGGVHTKNNVKGSLEKFRVPFSKVFESLDVVLVIRNEEALSKFFAFGVSKCFYFKSRFVLVTIKSKLCHTFSTMCFSWCCVSKYPWKS
jgi:hypothetical protein